MKNLLKLETALTPVGTIQSLDELRRSNENILEIIPETTRNYIGYNILPGKPIEETLYHKEYRVGFRYIEAVFDREYKSSMENCPTHLDFLTVLTHTQKLLYIALCKEFGFTYDPFGRELFKISYNWVETSLPQLIHEEEELLQRLAITRFEKLSSEKYSVHAECTVNNKMNISADFSITIIQ